MSVISKNAYLTQAEMEGNAVYIFNKLKKAGWSFNAICSTLANMQSESGINPGIYEGLDSESDTNGFGLVQWTPNTKYKSWASANGYNYGDIDGQIARILYELNNGIQWIATDTYPLTFEEYSTSNDSLDTLTYAFMYNYERPASLDQPHRKEYAQQWSTFLTPYNTGSPTTQPRPPVESVTDKSMSFIYKWFATRGVR